MSAFQQGAFQNDAFQIVTIVDEAFQCDAFQNDAFQTCFVVPVKPGKPIMTSDGHVWLPRKKQLTIIFGVINERQRLQNNRIKCVKIGEAAMLSMQLHGIDYIKISTRTRFEKDMDDLSIILEITQ